MSAARVTEPRRIIALNTKLSTESLDYCARSRAGSARARLNLARDPFRGVEARDIKIILGLQPKQKLRRRPKKSRESKSRVRGPATSKSSGGKNRGRVSEAGRREPVHGPR